jgi:hypothetical protein
MIDLGQLTIEFARALQFIDRRNPYAMNRALENAPRATA